MNFGIYNPHRVIVTPISDNKTISNYSNQLSVGVAETIVFEALALIKSREIQLWNDSKLTTILFRIGSDCSSTEKTLALVPKHLYIVNTLARISAFVVEAGVFDDLSEEIPLVNVTISSP